MVVDDKTFFTLSSNRKSLIAVASLFALTPEEIDHPNCGEWVKDQIKQLQTAMIMYKASVVKKNENQSIDNFIPDPFVGKQNPLLESDLENK